MSARSGSPFRARPLEAEEEILRLRGRWRRPGATGTRAEACNLDQLPGEAADEIAPFDRVQLAHVVAVCRRSKTLSDAGRELFAISRQKRAVANDPDRLKKYLARFELSFEACQSR
jgi:transcriptional regulatory protein RtcR